jgi:hypothetical protein
MIGMNVIKAKRRIQWDRSQIMVSIGSKIFFFTLAELYFDLNNTAMMKLPNV